jgi:inorganic triphosphatase YgiF
LILFRESLGTLRLRESGGKHKVTLKWSVGKTGATLTRTETEEAVTEQAARDILNHRLFNEARGVLNTAELLPVLAVENKRTIIDFRLGDSCIELSLDAMHFRVADAGVHTFRRQQAGPFFEVEAENKGASEKEFGLFIRALVCNFTLTPSSDVKYERGVKALGLVEG